MTLNDENLLLKYQREKNGAKRRAILVKGRKNADVAKIPLFIEALNDPDVDNKVLAIKILGELALPSTLKPLIELTKHRLEIKEDLISAIVKVVQKYDLGKIMPLFLEYDNLNVKKTIPLILGELEDVKTKNYLIDFLYEENPIVRKNSIRALTKKLDKEDISHLIKLVDDNDLGVKKEVIKLFGMIGGKIAIKILKKLLYNENEALRVAASRSLYKIFKKNSNMRPLYDLIKSRNRLTRKEAVRLLGMIKNPDSLKQMIRLLNSRDGQIRRLAYGAILKTLKKHPNSIILIQESLQAKEWQIRKYSAKILGKLEDENSISHLLKKLNDSKASVRRNVSIALSKMNPSKIINMVKPYLVSEDWKVRRATVDLLRKIGSSEAIKPLIRCINDDDIYIRSWVIKSLGEIPGEQTLDVLHDMLNNEDARIRLSAIKAIKGKKNEKSISFLIQALGDDDFSIRKEIEETLNLINPNWMSKL